MHGTIRRPAWPAIGRLMAASIVFLAAGRPLGGADPPAINPFGPKTPVREDGIPGYLETSDGAIHPGRIYLTRDKRLEIVDEELQRQREIPLQSVRQIDCAILKEWMEKEWKFKEAASSEKVYTGRDYPAREYVHTITLQDGRTITGPLSALVYLEPDRSVDGPSPGESAAARPPSEPEQHLLNKRAKGEVGDDLKSMIYVKRIKLGDEALAEGRRKAGPVDRGPRSAAPRP